MPLEVKDLSVFLASGEVVTEHISFQIEKGKMLSIVGSSGAGKTTICKAIMGLLGSTYKATGEVWFQGKNLLSLSKKECQKIYGKEICFIMQNPMTAFNPSLRVGKQLEKTFLQHHARTSKDEMFSLFDKTLRQLGLEDTERILKSYPFTLSGGMLQRLMITAALINQPQILVADEATTAIDACNRVELMKELRAAVPADNPTAYLHPIFLHTSRSTSLIFAPTVDIQFVSYASWTYFISSPCIVGLLSHTFGSNFSICSLSLNICFSSSFQLLYIA